MKATWILPDGRSISAEVPTGRILMEAAVAASVSGVVGECGGSQSCATWHVFVDQIWTSAAGRPEPFENGMLYVAETERTEPSRLLCPIKMTEALDGIVLWVPQV